MKCALVVTFVVLSACSAFSQTTLEWMAGSWSSDQDGVRMEEHWTRGDGTLMIGMHQDVAANGKTSFEFLRIERRDGKLVYLAMPHARPETPFPLKSVTADRVVFENPDHDFPQRIIYWRDGARLCARTEGTIGQPLLWYWPTPSMVLAVSFNDDTGHHSRGSRGGAEIPLRLPAAPRKPSSKTSAHHRAI